MWGAAKELWPFAFHSEGPAAMMPVMSKVSHPPTPTPSLNSCGPPDHRRVMLGQLTVMAFIDSARPWRLSEDHTPRTWNCCHSWHRLSAQIVSMRQKANQHLPVLSREINTCIFLFLVPLKLWWCRCGVCLGPSNRQYLVYVNFPLKLSNKSGMHWVCPCKKHLLYCSWIPYRKSSLN